jgi:putative transposase
MINISYQIGKENTSSRPFEKGIFGYMCLDALVYSTDMRLTEGRPWLIVLIDDYSKRVLGFNLSLTPPTYSTNMMVLRECVERHSLLPESIVFSGGKEFRKEQFQSLLDAYDLKAHVRPMIPIRTLDFENLNKTTYKFVVQHQKFPWFFEDLRKSLSKFLYEFYDNSHHIALGTSPRDFFQAALESFDSNKYVPYDEKLILLTCPMFERKFITERGLKINNFHYWAEDLMQPNLNMKKINVKFDDEDIDTVFAFINGNWIRLTRYMKKEKDSETVRSKKQSKVTLEKTTVNNGDF